MANASRELPTGSIATVAVESGDLPSSIITYQDNRISSPPIITSQQQFKQLGLTAQACASGVIGGGQDATAALVKLGAECAGLGLTGIIGAGDYPISAPIGIDEANSPVIDAPRGGLKGEGPNATRIRTASGVAAIQIKGGTAGGPGMVYNSKFSDMLLLGTGLNASGISIDNFAWGEFDNIFATGYDAGIFGSDFLSSTISNCRFRGNKRGMSCSFTDFSRPNALTLLNNNFGQNSEYGASFNGQTTLTVIGGAFEGNGWTGTGAFSFVGGLSLVNGGVEGAAGASFRGVYFEYNNGTADVQISHDSNDAAYLFDACTFNRIDATKNVQNNLLLANTGAGRVSVNLSACGFKGFGTYVEQANFPYVAVTGNVGVQVVDHPGNLYKSNIAFLDPAMWGPATRAGNVAGNGTEVSLPRKWTCSRVSAGVYRVDHNLGHADYTVTADVADTGSFMVERTIKATTYFNVVTTNTDHVLADAAFSFNLQSYRNTI